MPRQPRYFVPGIPLHVIQRGNNRQPIFRDAADFRFYLETLRMLAAEHGVAVHAYVLMDNHVHLLASPHESQSLPRTMQALGVRYVHRFNERQRRTGTLWEGRYRATIVDDERYLFTCMRYVEENPVRASMVAMPGDYRWSSFRANAHGHTDPLVTPHEAYTRLGTGGAERRTAYRSLFRQPLAQSEVDAVRYATNSAWALGSEVFAANVEIEARRRARPLPRGRKLPAAKEMESDPN